jgi:hypothetical protein
MLGQPTVNADSRSSATNGPPTYVDSDGGVLAVTFDTSLSQNGGVTVCHHNNAGHWHRLDGPAAEQFYPSGQIRSHEYVVSDDVHRVGGPAHLEWFENGQLESVAYYEKDHHHRVGGPAYERWFDNGQMRTRRFTVKGRHHRVGGPAEFEWDESGALVEYWFWFQGVRVLPSPLLEEAVNPATSPERLTQIV